MRRIRHILVVIKNPAAVVLPAVAKSAQLAYALGADLTLFQAVSSPLPASEEFPPRHLILRALDYEACLKAIALRLRRRGIRVSISALSGQPPDEAILHEAARVGADLIVADAHAPGNRSADAMGPSDWDLLSRSPIPVLLVKNPGPYRRPKVLAALDPDHTFDKPVSLDAEIVALGAIVSEALNGVLHAVHAYAPVSIDDQARGTSALSALAVAQSRAEETAAKKLALATRGMGIPKSRRHILGRHVPDAIEQVARETKSAIVVMGAVARSGLWQLLIGNTAERVLGQLPSDILLVKPSAQTKRARRARVAALSTPSPLPAGT